MSEEKGRGSIGFGVLLGMGGLLVLGALFGTTLSSDSKLLQSQFLVAILGIGVTQWVVLLPLIFWMWKRGETKTVQGILVTGGLVFLLNATCWGLMMGSRIQ